MPDGGRCREPLEKYGRRNGGLCSASAREQAAECSMENAQLGLGRGVLVAVVVSRPSVIVMLVRGEIIVEVPGRMDERALLCAEQQDGADGVKESPLQLAGHELAPESAIGKSRSRRSGDSKAPSGRP